jgi:hypothetical protein
VLILQADIASTSSRPDLAVTEPATFRPIDRRAACQYLTAYPIRGSTRNILAEPFAVTMPADPGSIVEDGPLRPGDPTGVGDWRLVSRLGRGGMADVFYALASDGRTAP